MKKLFIFLVYLLCARSYGMMPDLSQKQIKEEAAKTAARFGGFEYLEHAVKEYGGPAVDKLEKIKKVMTDSCYAFVLLKVREATPTRSVAYQLSLVKKVSSSGKDSAFLCIGFADFCKKAFTDSCYVLNYLRVLPCERNRGLGEALFLYGVHIIRQLAYSSPNVNLTWESHPFGVVRLERFALNRFYEKLGGIHGVEGCKACAPGKVCERCAKLENFYWNGSSLKPYELIVAHSGPDKKIEAGVEAATALPQSNSTRSNLLFKLVNGVFFMFVIYNALTCSFNP